MTKINISLADLVQRLDDGNMLSEPLVKFLVERAINTTDSRPLYEYLENYPIILTRAERNINMKMYKYLTVIFLNNILSRQR